MASLTLAQTPVFWAQNCSGRVRRAAICNPVAPPSLRVISGLQSCELHSQSQHGSSRRALVIMATQAGAGGARAGKPMKKKVKKLVDINGDVTKDLGNSMFQVKLDNGVSVMAYLSGKIQQNRIRIVMGDKVTVELSPYDLTKGRITYRFRPEEIAAMAADKKA